MRNPPTNPEAPNIYRNGWKLLEGKATAFETGKCMPKSEVECLVQLVENGVATLYLAYAAAANAHYDVQEAPLGPTKDYFEQVFQAQQASVEAMLSAYSKMAESCK